MSVPCLVHFVLDLFLKIEMLENTACFIGGIKKPIFYVEGHFKSYPYASPGRYTSFCSNSLSSKLESIGLISSNHHLERETIQLQHSPIFLTPACEMCQVVIF